MADDSRFFEAKQLKDLGNGIFAFAMTFLIVTIDIPKVPLDMFRSEASKMAPDILTYVISFLLLAIFWVTNHIQLKDIKKADSRIIWISMLLFLSIVFVPLSTDLYAFYDGSRLAMLLFNLNILAIGFIFVLQWHHLVSNSLHHEEFTEDEIKDRYRISIALVLVSLAAIFVGWFNPVWSGSVYFILFIYSIGRRLNWFSLNSNINQK